MAKLKDGFYKLTASSIGSDLLVLLAGGGAKPISDFASSFNVKLWGNTFDGSQDVNGWVSLPNTIGIYGTDTEGNKNHILLYSDSNVVNVGGGSAVRGHDTRIFGNNIYLAYSSNRTDGLTLKSDGLITIAKSIFSGNSAFGQGRLELSGGTPFIDFHFNESTADYTSRIIEKSSGELTCEKAWKVGGATTLCSTLSVQGTGTFNSQIISNVADGTAPLVIASTTKVDNLNADLLDGYHATGFYRKGDDNQYGNRVSLSTINTTPGDNYVWNSYNVATLKLSASNNSMVFIVGGVTNDRNALILVGHKESSTYSEHLGNLYLNKFGGKVYIGTTEAATIDSNVASATKLQTPRTIWGQSFDGTTNVSGLITIGLNLLTNPTILFFNGEFIDGYGNIKMSKDANTWSVGHKDTVSSGVGLFVQALGNVGIGTNTPTAKLDVLGYTKITARASVYSNTTPLVVTGTGSNTSPRLIQAFSPDLPIGTTGAYGVHLLLGVSDTAYNFGYMKFVYAGAGSTDNALRFGFHTSDNLMSILGNGNVGIGTTSPSKKLHVIGSIAASSHIFGSFGANRHFAAGGGDDYVWIDSRDSSSNVKNNIILRDGRTSTMVLSPHGNNLYSCGTSTLRWSNVYSVLGDFSGLITSSVATGTSPFNITSTTVNANLNADLLDGYHATNFLYRSLYGGNTGSYVFKIDSTDVGWVYLGRFYGASGGIKIECDYTSHCAHDYGICSSHLIVGVRPYTLEGFISKVAGTGGGLYIVQDNSSGYKYYYIYMYIKAWFQGQVRIQDLGRTFEWSKTVASPDSSYTCVLDTRNLDGYYTCHKGVITRIDNRDANTLDGLDSTNFMKVGDSYTKSESDSRYVNVSGDTMGAAGYLNFNTTAAPADNSAPFGITYGRIQSLGPITICGDTDGSTTEYVNITAGYGIANATAANGLSIGYKTLKWKGYNVITTSSMGLITISKSLKLTTSWQDTGIYCSDIGTGSFVVRIEGLSDYTVGGGHYLEAYTGLMSSFSGSSNSSYTDEIPLHRCGHAPNHGIIYLRTLRVSGNASSPKLLIAATYNATEAYTYTFKFRRII